MPRLLFSAVFLSFISVGCASHRSDEFPYQAVNFNALPEIAVEYQSFVIKNKSKGDLQVWRLLRDNERIEIQYPNTGISDVWSQTSRNLWFYEKFFHEDKQIIQYSPVDLKVLEVTPPWSSLALAIDPKILQSIGTGRSATPLNGWNRQIFKGNHNQAAYEIEWLPELGLAVYVTRTLAGVTTVTEASKIFLKAEAPWDIHDITAYRLIDYSDLGDMERDPFVLKVQGQVLGAHDHAHP